MRRPKEKWIEAGRYLLARFPCLVISTGPDADEVVLGRGLQATLVSNVLCTEGKTSWAQLAGLLYGARLFVGVDTAAMHLAAACECPVVAIFWPDNRCSVATVANDASCRHSKAERLDRS